MSEQMAVAIYWGVFFVLVGVLYFIKHWTKFSTAFNAWFADLIDLKYKSDPKIRGKDFIGATLPFGVGDSKFAARTSGLYHCTFKADPPDDVAVVQIYNPRDERWIKINRFEAHCLGQKKSEGPYKNVPIVGEW